MDEQSGNPCQKKIFTIPNLLSMFRLLLVPVLCWTYLGLGNLWWTIGLLALSALTDLLDGWIARTFHMTSDLGKALDPIADKVTQGAMLICLMIQYPALLAVFVMLAVKELSDGISGLLVIRRTGGVLGAEWHGKLSTVVLFLTMTVHVLWQFFPQAGQVPLWLTWTLVVLCIGVLLLSMILYLIRNLRAANAEKKTNENASISS